jgi:hypothetical protein
LTERVLQTALVDGLWADRDSNHLVGSPGCMVTVPLGFGKSGDQ